LLKDEEAAVVALVQRRSVEEVLFGQVKTGSVKNSETRVYVD